MPFVVSKISSKQVKRPPPVSSTPNMECNMGGDASLTGSLSVSSPSFIIIDTTTKFIQKNTGNNAVQVEL